MPSVNAEPRGSCIQPVPEEVITWLQELHRAINKPREARGAEGTSHEYSVTVFETIRQLTEDELSAILQAVKDHQLILWIKTKGSYSFGYSVWQQPPQGEIDDDNDCLLWLSPEHFPLAPLPDLTSRPTWQEIKGAVFTYMEPYLRNKTNLALLERYGFEAPRGRSSYEY